MNQGVKSRIRLIFGGIRWAKRTLEEDFELLDSSVGSGNSLQNAWRTA
jgi:hypothetical protein